MIIIIVHNKKNECSRIKLMLQFERATVMERERETDSDRYKENE